VKEIHLRIDPGTSEDLRVETNVGEDPREEAARNAGAELAVVDTAPHASDAALAAARATIGGSSIRSGTGLRRTRPKRRTIAKPSTRRWPRDSHRTVSDIPDAIQTAIGKEARKLLTRGW